ncbi:GNAT family N-acetyltransferase [Nocardioides solisilvae]|uniref:GNAT family N-acetyltransferase n=1 Tax=Nocardioides solisilvae TaxID=1542435 RepID=UPI000D74C4B2|nr:GNAT family N-acetyltransferase [Nocardioides solisilvae]
MRLLVLGGTRFVGRALVAEAVRRGDDVTVVHRGTTGSAPPGVRTLLADRRAPGSLAEALASAPGGGEWDAVVDTWSAEPVAVRDAVRLLRDRTGHYGYVSSRSVYRWPPQPGADEDAPVVDGDAGGTDAADYAAAKRGGELAVLEGFADRSLLARAGLILGPHEDVGRLPWWLHRTSRGGVVPAPGPPDLPLQYVDARDLAAWLLDAAERAVTGTFNAVGPRGHATMSSLLGACRAAVAQDGPAAELVWLTPREVAAAGATGWNDLPIWTPPDSDLAGLHHGDVSAAQEAGLRCRPVEETVADTWEWLRAEGMPAPRTDRPPLGPAPAVDRALAELAAGAASRVTLRPAVVDDVPEVMAFWGRAAEDAHRPADSTAAVERLLARDSEALVLAEADGRIVGTVVVGWDGWRCHLYRLAVDPERRRQGIGARLIAHAEERFRSLGGTRSDAMVLDDNDLAHAAWRAAGYAPQSEWSRWVKPLGG